MIPRVRARGQSIVYAVLLMPTLFLIVALAIDIANLQAERLRLAYALDLATVAGAQAVDSAAYTRTGTLRLDGAAAGALTREYLLRNLQGTAGTPDPQETVGAAEIRVINDVPARDPFRGNLLDRPSVCARLRVAHQFVFLGWIGLRSVEIAVTADADIRA